MDDPSAHLIEGVMLPGEQLLWSGRPRRGLVFRPWTAHQIGFAVGGLGVLVLWAFMVSQPGGGGGQWIAWLPIAPFVLLCLCIVMIPFCMAALNRRRAHYAITNQRILILGDSEPTNTQSVSLRSLGEVTIRENGDGSGTISHGGMDPSDARKIGASFEEIDQVRDVYDIIIKARDSAAQIEMPPEAAGDPTPPPTAQKPEMGLLTFCLWLAVPLALLHPLIEDAWYEDSVRVGLALTLALIAAPAVLFWMATRWEAWLKRSNRKVWRSATLGCVFVVIAFALASLYGIGIVSKIFLSRDTPFGFHVQLETWWILYLIYQVLSQYKVPTLRTCFRSPYSPNALEPKPDTGEPARTMPPGHWWGWIFPLLLIVLYTGLDLIKTRGDARQIKVWLGEMEVGTRAVAAPGSALTIERKSLGSIHSVRTLSPLLQMRPGLADTVTSLTLRRVDVGSLDILGRLPRLRSLTIESDSFLDTAAFRELPALEHLTLKGIRHGSPELFWKRWHVWVWLEVKWPPIRDLGFLSGLKGLKSLAISSANYGDDLVDLTALAGLPNLKSLSLKGCQSLNDLTPLAAMPDLEHVSITACRNITDLEPLSGLKNLTGLTAWNWDERNRNKVSLPIPQALAERARLGSLRITDPPPDPSRLPTPAPPDLEAPFREAARQYDMGNFKEARKLYEDLLDPNPSPAKTRGISDEKRAEAIYWHAESCLALDDYEAANGRLLTVLMEFGLADHDRREMSPFFWRYIELCARINQKQGEPAMAIGLLEVIVAKNPDFDEIERVRRQIEQLKRDDPARVLAAYEALLKQNSGLIGIDHLRRQIEELRNAPGGREPAPTPVSEGSIK